MLNSWDVIRSRSLILMLLGSMLSSSFLHGQIPELMKKSNELISKVRVYETEARAETQKKILKMRERALSDLQKLRNQYVISNKKVEADLITKEIEMLKKKMVEAGRPGLIGKGNRERISNKYFKYRIHYHFNEEGVISGRLVFMPNLKVRVIYHYKGVEESGFWDWKDMGDHVQIETGSSLGTIIISERPKSNHQSLLIRWGGELINKLTDANAE